MVEPDAPIAVFGQALGRRFGLAQPFRRAGQRRLVDHALMGLHPGDMGVAEQGQPVRLQSDRLVDGLHHELDRLVRQAVHEIEVDGRDAGATQPGDHFGRHLEGLDPVDRPLDDVVEILHAQAGPRHPGPRQGDRLVFGQRPRVDLDRHLGPRGEGKALAQRRHQGGEILRREHGRGAAAPVDMGDLGPLGDGAGNQTGLALEHPCIVANRCVLAHDLGVAAAVPAHAGAERDMEIERHPLVARDGGEPVPIDLGIHACVEMRRRRVARVPGDRCVVTLQEFYVHGAILAVPDREGI